ncbi:ferredoxin [Desulfospira joergensenii]|uniref:ferredoxin n=1 Tax=Desulfospira joergensenii TaxID=53329 RepID=UPI0003B60FBF|nr:ferredoxin [Desulfospira joergensenii]
MNPGKNKPAPAVPCVDLECCILCEVCVELAPHAFKMNDAGFVEVIPLDRYDDKETLEAVNNCPRDCIVME